jgi:signal transduction histidine kinase
LKPRLLVLLLLIVALPLGLLAAVGGVLAREDRAIQEHRLRELLRGRLVELDASIGRVIEERGRDLGRLAETAALDPDALRELARTEPLARQAFVLNADGRLIFPAEAHGLTAGERRFLERSDPVWRRGELAQLVAGRMETATNQSIPFDANPDPGAAPDAPSAKSNTVQQLAQAPQKLSNLWPAGPSGEAGWYTWYWGSGSHFMYWRRREEGRVLGLEVERARLIADIIGALPETDRVGGEGKGDSLGGRIALRDANGETIYQWGKFEPAEKEKPAVSLGLSPPLHAWRVDQYVPAGVLDGGDGSLFFSMFTGMAACGAVLILMAFTFYRESSREMREAAQRVNFVNQVSHELKTPLTNIRMYAELMEGKLAEDADPKTRQYLDVISSESRRLSRLIGNVLTFGRGRRKSLTLHPKPCRVDEVVREAVERFRPALERRGLRVETALETGEPLAIDADALEQILGNLLNNAEKYAGGEGTVRVTCRRERDLAVLEVADEGPGIAAGEREKIFRPFYRVSNKLSDGVSGAGIGLSIARELARLHGGDVRLIDSEHGARFEVRLRALDGN